MKACKKHEKDRVAYLYGELKGQKRERFLFHLKRCLNCQEELEILEKLKERADTFQVDIKKAMDTVDWQVLPSKITEAVFRKASRPARKSWPSLILTYLRQPKLRPVYAGILVGVLIGSLVTFFLLQGPFRERRFEARFVVSQDFLERAELEIARREDIDYLDRSQFLLLDVVQYTPEKKEEIMESELNLDRIKDLLSEKKYINAQLDKFQLAKAKEICDQIELLFYELTQLSDQLTKEDLERIQRLIEDNQILLKIKLLKRELKGSEV